MHLLNWIFSIIFLLSSLVSFGQSADSLLQNTQNYMDSATARLVRHALAGRTEAGKALIDSIKASGIKGYFRLSQIEIYLLETLLGRPDSALAAFREHPTPMFEYEAGRHIHNPNFPKLLKAGLSDTLFRTSTTLTPEDKAFAEYQRQRIYERFIWLFDKSRTGYETELHKSGGEYRAVNALQFQRKYPSSRYMKYLADEIMLYKNISLFRFGVEMLGGPMTLFGAGGLKASIGYAGELVMFVFTERWSLGAGGSTRGCKSPEKFYYGHDSVAAGARVGLFGGMIRGEYRFKALPTRSLSITGSYRFGDGRLEIGKSRKDNSDSSIGVKGGYDISLGVKRGWGFGFDGDKGKAMLNFEVFVAGQVGYFHPVQQIHGFYANVSAGFGWYLGRATTKISRVMRQRLRWKPVPEKLELVVEKPRRRSRMVF